MKKAVVTGSTGMLALATADRLLKEGYEVIALVRPGSARESNIPDDSRIHKIRLDMKDIDRLPLLLKEQGLAEDIELFFHFAWDGTHGDSRNNCDIQIENIRTSVEAVRCAAALGCKAFLGAGSQAEYGRVPDGVSLAPDTPVNPITGYGMGKLAAGKLTRIEAEKLGIKHVWVRILSVYGPFDGMHTMVMSGIGNLLEGKKASYTKGEQLWDYLYCKDAAKAFFLAATKGKNNAVYPVGSGRVRPLKDYITDIRDAVNPDAPLGFGEVDYYPDQVMYLCADISSLTADTGFVPEYGFAEGIKETVEWYKEHCVK